MTNGKGGSIHLITFTLLVIGGLNWLVYGLFGWDIGAYLPGGMTGMTAKIVYLLVGVSALYEIALHKQHCKVCSAMASKQQDPMSPSMPGKM